jgi:2-octaprenyl-6-methoxyphenol hydroxylase
MVKSKKSDEIVVLGGGLAGMTMACILGDYGFDVVCIDREKPVVQSTENYDGRTTAISAGSKRVLEAINVWEEIDKHACPIEQIRVADGQSSQFLHFDSLDAGLGDFGWIIENFRLRNALFKKLKACKTVKHITGVAADSFEYTNQNIVNIKLSNGKSIETPLLIAADGVNSKTREWLGIKVRKWSYKQTAIVCNVGHELNHDNIAVEHFMPAGPFAILPMTDLEDGTHRSSLVWTEHGGEAQSLAALAPKNFNAMLQEKFGNQLGKVWAVTAPQTFDLNLCHAKSYTAKNVALIAEAAHRIHPIAGQGLNLSMRDIACLAEVLTEARNLGMDLGSLTTLNRYQKWRRGDNLSMAVMTDALTRLFSNNHTPVRVVRDFGLGLINRLPPAKHFFEKQAMGLSGKLPKIIRTGSL